MSDHTTLDPSLLRPAGTAGSQAAPSPRSSDAASPLRPRGRMRTVVMSAAVGGLVGAVAASGAVLTLGDRGSTTVLRSSQVPVFARPSTQLGRTGDIASIIEKSEPAVVAITTGGGPGSGGAAGTGFVITSDGYIATNNHVIEGAKKIEVAFTNGDAKPAKLVGRDPSVDLAVLKVDATNLPAIQLGNSNAAQVGDDVVAIGNALALEGGLSVTHGIISGTNRAVPEENGATLVGMLQTDAAINPGNSGGPLLDARGRVVGINTAIANPQEAQNIGFAIPISRAEPIIADLRAGRKPAYLGVSTVDVTPATAREAGLAVNQGAYVERASAGPAADAGIRKGDVIVRIADTTITNSADVQTAVRSHHPGDTVTVVVDRKGNTTTLQVELAERPATG